MTDPFAGAGKDVGVRIWRVKDFSLLDEPKQSHGQFFSGDCYLVLDSFKAEGTIRHHIHFWLGKDTTADEAGSVAMFAAQLDDSLGGGPVQFRQPQGSESAEFLRLFPRLKYMSGGFASGFRDTSKAKGSGPVRLYQIKSPNRTCVQVFEVPCCLASLNHGDCFLLEDVGARLLWVWHGAAANVREKTRAIEAGNAFKEGTGIKLSVLDDGDDVSGEAAAFFSRLGCAQPPKPEEIRELEADPPKPALMQQPQLFKVVDGGSSFERLSADGCPLSQSLLDPAGQFVLLAAGCIWVWTGQNSSDSKKAAPPLQVGGRFASSQGLPAGSLVKAVKARFEPGLFATYFADWGSDGRSSSTVGTPGRDSFGNVIPGPGKGTDEQPYNAEEAAAAMVALVAAAEAAEPAVRGQAATLEAAYGNLTSSKIQVWAMIGASSLELPRQEMGHFYDGASYIVLHSYSTSRDTTDLRYAVYVWQGRRCGNLEQGAAAVMAADLHRSRYSGRSTLVRVEQGLEPGHFVRLFKGTMIVRRGPRPSNLAPGRSPPGLHLYQVKGEAVSLAHAVEVAPASASLSSNDCFLLERVAEVGAASSEPVVLWRGAASSEIERQVAATVAGVLAGSGPAVQTVEEGQEPSSFWEALGGKSEYASSGRPHGGRGLLPAPRLFHLIDRSVGPGGRAGLKVQLLTTFSQESLANDDVMLLDTGAELYVWYGSSCKHTERPRGRDVAQRYLVASGRSGAVGLVEVESGREPPFFSCHFAGWDSVATVAVIPDIYTEKLKALALAKEAKEEELAGAKDAEAVKEAAKAAANAEAA
ncbi:hypothetical protein PLESTB_001357700 [Pleodorina starrii]|uniref:Gelsolin n=1 Tax=Pleodorina starrii TaxID=330485 RepID=A0A9W6BUS0_9CHLO|nr:hypothetical protein PLESTM_001917500 [Pleodorina starrii]GLC58428.1 hypothetical protein PLESTB_001357700 [Pleodorina starrii]GLC76483.1 hypothetical protein PLESTF_001786100 [Pleodorina starrii]